MDEKKYWIWLTLVFGTGSMAVWNAVSPFDSAQEAYESLKSGSSDLTLKPSESLKIDSVGLEEAEKIIKECEDKGIGILCCTDPEYPVRLKRISAPPAVLYYQGDLTCLKCRRSVAVAGARRSSDYSLGAAERISRELAEQGVLIVSGFAVGTDIAAHMAAASAGYPTVCVLGCGIDFVYPKPNWQYRERILESGGLFVSEYPPGTQAQTFNFPKRNRILVGLGDVLIVFEASMQSGSLISAGIAAEEDIDIFALPPENIFAGYCAGSASLLQNGAIPLISTADVIDYMKWQSGIGAGTSVLRNRGIIFRSMKELKRSVSEAPKERPQKKSVQNERQLRIKFEASVNETAPAAEASAAENDLTGLKKSIAELIRSGANHADVLAARLDMDTEELMTEIMELELEGVVRSLPGNKYELTK